MAIPKDKKLCKPMKSFRKGEDRNGDSIYLQTCCNDKLFRIRDDAFG
jgi:hypothetical protein